jgi:hypothetical protein
MLQTLHHARVGSVLDNWHARQTSSVPLPSGVYKSAGSNSSRAESAGPGAEAAAYTLL